MDDSNPYAAPADLTASGGLDDAVSFFRDGKFLTVRDGAELPEVCLLTNEPADERAWRRKVRIAWTPPWVFLLLLVNLIVLLVVMLVTQKKAKITYSLSAASRSRIVFRRSIGFVLFLGFIGAIAFGIMSDSEAAAGIAFAAGLVSLIAALVFFMIANPVKVLKFKNGWFRIKGCSEDFLARLPEYPSPF